MRYNLMSHYAKNHHIDGKSLSAAGVPQTTVNKYVRIYSVALGFDNYSFAVLNPPEEPGEIWSVT
jgi:hypothetical protein